jgi:outer membrane immunogenic protein
MKRLVLITAAVVTFATFANAADLPPPPEASAPMYKAPPPPPYWTGCYIGAGGGYGMWNQDTAIVGIGATNTNGGRGWFGTGQFGCDYQFNSIVIGAFGDYEFSGLSGTLALPSASIQGSENESAAWAAGARAGLLVTPKFLTYVSGGFTQARFDQVNFASSATSVATGTDVGRNTYSGWFLGSGFEYALDSLPLLSIPLPPGLFIKTEYRYSSFSSANLPILMTATGPTGFSVSSQKSDQTISTELVWRFNFLNPGY